MSDLENANLLDTPSTYIVPGQEYSLVFDKGIGFFDATRFTTYLDSLPVAQYFYTHGDKSVTVEGSAVGVLVTAKSQQASTNTIDMIFATPMRRVVPRFGDAILSLTHVFEQTVGKTPDVVHQLVADGKFRPPTDDIFGLAALERKIGSTAKDIFVALVVIMILVSVAAYFVKRKPA